MAKQTGTKVLAYFAVLALLAASLCQGYEIAPSFRNFSLGMPLSKPTHPEAYLCTPMKLEKEARYVVGFQPRAEMKTAHHMLLYGCKDPGRTEKIFNCGAMAVKEEKYHSSIKPCGWGTETIIYAWAKNAPELKLPDDVAFHIGGDSGIDWLVLQVHYASVDAIPPEGDDSGVNLIYTTVPQAKFAGIFYTSSSGRMAANSVTHLDVSCKVHPKKIVHPFAFRVHTHDLGTAVSGWKVSPDMTWTLIGKQDPQLPQMFYPVEDNRTEIGYGDTIASRCIMDNFKDHAVYVGSTKDDEMCNFYLMYWADEPDVLQQSYCTSLGFPLYTWSRWILGGGLSNIPSDDELSL